MSCKLRFLGSKTCECMKKNIMWHFKTLSPVNCDILLPQFSFCSAFWDAYVIEFIRCTWCTKATKMLRQEKSKHLSKNKQWHDILLSQNMWVDFGSALIATNPFVWTFKFRLCNPLCIVVLKGFDMRQDLRQCKIQRNVSRCTRRFVRNTNDI